MTDAEAQALVKRVQAALNGLVPDLTALALCFAQDDKAVAFASYLATDQLEELQRLLRPY